MMICWFPWKSGYPPNMDSVFNGTSPSFDSWMMITRGSPMSWKARQGGTASWLLSDPRPEPEVIGAPVWCTSPCGPMFSGFSVEVWLNQIGHVGHVDLGVQQILDGWVLVERFAASWTIPQGAAVKLQWYWCKLCSVQNAVETITNVNWPWFFSMFVSSSPALVSWRYPGSLSLLYLETDGDGVPKILLSITGWWLVYPSEKYWSIGMMTFPIYGKIELMFQTTNQITIGGGVQKKGERIDSTTWC